MEIFRNYIDREWIECKSGKTFPNVNPANTDETVGLFQASGPEDAQAACDVAAQAQPACRIRECCLRTDSSYPRRVHRDPARSPEFPEPKAPQHKRHR